MILEGLFLSGNWSRNTVEVSYVPESQFGQTIGREVNVRIPRRRRVDNRKKISGHKARDIAHAVGEWNSFSQTLASSRTGTRTEDTDGIEFKTSCKLVIRSYCSRGSWRKFKSADDWSENSGSQRSSETTSASHLEDWAQLNCCREGQQTL